MMRMRGEGWNVLKSCHIAVFVCSLSFADFAINVLLC